MCEALSYIFQDLTAAEQFCEAHLSYRARNDFRSEVSDRSLVRGNTSSNGRPSMDVVVVRTFLFSAGHLLS